MRHATNKVPSPRGEGQGEGAAKPLLLCALAAALLPTACASSSDGDWDVADIGLPYTEAEFTVTEGTWMSVAVSPDGESIVFDLLGDIYRIPAAGGEAQAVHAGAPMYRSPRFSPDGSRLLYISDADGHDNLWLSNPDGSQARPITAETVDLLSAPAWTPDGGSVAAARAESTFPKTRASEIRLYDLAGGSGRVLVETPDNERDVQEANFSPDGRWLYYTEKVSAPAIFVDANHIHHVVRRRDLHSGEVETVVGGFGGAVAPQIAPDGRRLAFVRRVMHRTVLFVYDLETREQRPVYAELDRDMQADIVPHGHYYPAYDWFPDGRHIAIWGKGKLYRIDTHSGEAEAIPFRATSRHRYARATRLSHDLAPETVEVKALRHPAVAPDGDTLVFHAVGYLWRQALPDGTPERLTDAEAFEFEPAWSGDGRRLAWVEWHDERGSALQVMELRRGRVRAVATSPGVIREPSFSPDGESLVYRVEDGNKNMGGYRARGGLYRVAATGGEAHFVTAAGAEPRFSANGERIYYSYTESGAGVWSSQVSVTKLDSVNLEGLDPRTHAEAPDAHELRIGPDGRWVTFKQDQQYYLAPYRETGRPMVLGARRKDVPMRQLSTEGGYGLHWAGGALYWTLGAELYRAQAVAEPGAEPPPPLTTIDLRLPADAPEGVVALMHGRVITMEDEAIIEDGTVVVENNRIAAVGTTGEVDIPDDATVIDLEGKTVMPGLVDMHGHIDCCYPDSPMPQKQPARYAALAFGVTTNFDPYSSELSGYASTEMTKVGTTVGPRFIGSGLPVDGRTVKPDFSYHPVNRLDDARTIMRRKHALGGTIIKSYRVPARNQRQQLVRAGADAGIMTSVEGGNHFYNNITQVLDGHTVLEHNLPVANFYDDVVQFMAHGDTANTPTLIVTYGEIFGENYIYQTANAPAGSAHALVCDRSHATPYGETNWWEDPRIKSYVQETNAGHYSPLGAPYGAPPHVRGMTALHAADEVWDIGFRSVARSVRKLDEAGVLINAGSHGQIAGLAMHWEMWLMAEGGMSNHRILHAATINGATTLGLEEQIGSLAPGKLADLIVLEHDPLEDIRHSASVTHTMINGRLYDAVSMDEIGNYQRPRSRFYWEMNDYGGIDWNEAWAR